MAGSIGVTKAPGPGGVTKYIVAWTADASGNVSGNTLTLKSGHLRQAKFVPGAGGVQPTDQYDVTLLDSDGVDLLFGLGADRSNATASVVPRLDGQNSPPGPICWVEGGLVTPTIANAGNAKSGTLIVFVGP